MLGWSIAPTQSEAGACELFELTFLQDGVPTVPPPGTAVQLQAQPAGSRAFYSDAACSLPLTAPDFASSPVARFHVRGTQAGTVQLLAGSTVGSSVVTHELIAGAPAALAFVMTPASARANDCVGPFTVALQDAHGNEATASADVLVGFAVTAGSATVHPGSACGFTSVARNIGPGASRASVYLRPQAASVTLQATAGCCGAAATTQPVESDGVVAVSVVGPASFDAGDCSRELRVRLQTSATDTTLVTADSNIDVDVLLPVTSGDLMAFTTPGCTRALMGPLVIPDGNNQVSFYVGGTQAGQHTVRVSTMANGEDTVELTIRAGSVTGARIGGATDLPIGICSPITVETIDVHGNRATSPSNNNATIGWGTGVPPTMYADSQCTQGLVGAAVTLSQGVGTFFVRGTVPEVRVVDATVEGLPTVSRELVFFPPVRRGSCVISGGSSANCSVAPPLTALDRSVLFFQATSNADAPSNALVSCELSSASLIRCQRASGPRAVTVNWQVAEFVRNVSVQHLTGSCDRPQPTIPISMVDPARAFVLHSIHVGGSIVGDNDLLMVRFNSPTELLVADQGGSCTTPTEYAIQVVEMLNGEVERIELPWAMESALEVSSSTGPIPPSSVLLHSVNVSTTEPVLCSFMLRGELLADSTMQFSRGLGSAACTQQPLTAMQYQRISFPDAIRVQQRVVDMATGVGVATVTVDPVDMLRTLVFTSGQGASGQGGGETTYATDDTVGVAVARLELVDSTTVRLSRDNNAAAARFTVYVVENSY